MLGQLATTERSRSTAAIFCLPLIMLVAVAVSAGGCGKGSDTSPASKAEQSNTSQTVPSTKHAATTPPAPKGDIQHPIVQIETNAGSIKIKLDREKSPGTVAHFLNYARQGFYNGLIFHYVEPGKMIAGGGYSTNYELKPAASTVRNEAHKGGKNVRGTIGLLRDTSLVDSANSQFFINLADAPQRDYKSDSAEEYGYCVFGEVIEGLEVAEQISKTPTADLSQKSADLVQTPKTPVVITEIRVLM